MSEQRREERRKLITFTAVHDFRKSTLLGYLGDLTLHGAMLVGSRPMEVDRGLILEISFPETPESPAIRLSLRARVVWCRHEEQADYYDTGVEFLELTDQERSVITAVLKRYQFQPESSG
jgi:hypothetical protein